MIRLFHLLIRHFKMLPLNPCPVPLSRKAESTVVPLILQLLNRWKYRNDGKSELSSNNAV